ncbi:helix-turn-helix domain-containing protein [Nonomuraea dietziae]|uniref:winged helix-turn-helix transcriptional regulator n=1 Tax=Nonomuraea dietziae TaxID=65515 RepID=UPI0031D696F8
MLGRTYDTQVCSAARALEVVGERWSLLIVRDALFAGATRFADFQRLGIATNILAKRLDSLVDSGILERRSSGEQPDRAGYAVTQKGLDLAPVIIALTQWGDRWAAPDGPAHLVSAHRLRGSDRRADDLLQLWADHRPSADPRRARPRHAGLTRHGRGLTRRRGCRAHDSTHGADLTSRGMAGVPYLAE